MIRIGEDDFLFMLMLWAHPGFFILMYLQIERDITSMVPYYIWLLIGASLGICFTFFDQLFGDRKN